MAQSLRVSTTKHFVQDLDRAQPILRACALGAISDLRRAFEQRPDLALRRYNRVKGVSPAVLEIDISGAARMLAHWHNQTLFLLAIGNHDVVKHYQRTGSVEREIAVCTPLPDRIAALTAAGFLTFDAEADWEVFAKECDPAWLTFLDTQQANAMVHVLERTSARGAHEWYFALLVGGPGTGKTSILLNLFGHAFELDMFPQFVIEDQVAEYIKVSAGIDLDGYRTTLADAARQSAGGILLIDDPQSRKDIARAREIAQNRHFKSVVVGVDPLQLIDDFDDATLERLCAGQGSELLTLDVCYRQKRIVGQGTKRILDVIAASSPYLAETKKRQFAAERTRVNELGNTLEFPNPSGRFRTRANAGVEDIKLEVDRLLRAPALWKHWQPYLIAYDDEGLGEIPVQWREQLKRLPNARMLPLSKAADVKGVEYQHTIIVLSEELFLQMEQGFEGSSRRVYESRRLLRIPVSRAKDSVMVFVYAPE